LHGGKRPRLRGAGGPRFVLVEPRLCQLGVAGAKCSLDAVGAGPDAQWKLGDPTSVAESVVRVAESELEREERPMRRQRDVDEAARRGELQRLVRHRPAFLLVPAKRSDQREHRQHVRDDLVLPALPCEPNPVGQARIRGS